MIKATHRVSKRELFKMTAIGALGSIGANASSGCSTIKISKKFSDSGKNDKDKDDLSLCAVEVNRIIQAMDGNIVALKDKSNRILSIVVGQFEANAIALGLSGKTPIRPITHDLIQNILESSNIKVLKAVVTEEKNNIFFAKLYLIASGHKVEIDCRPSDAIALSVRTKTPIYVNETVMSEKANGQTPSILG